MSNIKDAHWVKREDSDFQQNLSVTFELPQDLVHDMMSVFRLDSHAEVGKILFEELEIYMRDNKL